jgi:2-hydroxychromene-2-carboxylate isomerase
MVCEVTLYIDLRSPYSYLAKAEALALARDFAVRLDWLPFAIDIEGAYGGEVASRSERDWRKVRYLYMDARRLANRQGLIVRGPQKIFDPTIAHIGLLFAKAQGIFAAYHAAVSDRFWRRALDIEDQSAIGAIISEIGGDRDGFTHYLAGPGRADYAATVAAAEARGVFGVPSFLLDGELFWGADRIWLLRERLAAKEAPG